AATAVRENHQRQLCPHDGTILHALKRIGPIHRKTAEWNVLRRRRAGIPDGARQTRAGLEKLDTGGTRGRAQATEYDSVSPPLPKHQGSPHPANGISLITTTELCRNWLCRAGHHGNACETVGDA